MGNKEHNAQAERAKRLEEALKKGPPPPRSPHAFIQDKMREERQKRELEDKKR